ncbi:MAG TPA: ribosome-associated translation inhibitor RaiA [Thermoanaerobaculia bacterium]|nr:ribosome-associated translation inhibitor RaiA [Thermoanaerobaculia bacterium]
MSTEITGRNFELTPAIRELIETKLGRVEDRLFQDVIDVRVVLEVQKYRNICEILITGKDHDVKAVQESDESMEDAVNAAIDHARQQARKNRERIRDHHRDEGSVTAL